MISYRKRSLSSSSDEDLHSILVAKGRKEDLYACEVITCEFCDEAFLNKYSHLVHNANHIIIPLLRKTYFKCQECQLQCRTKRKLEKHIKKLHPYITKFHHNNNTKYSGASAELQIVSNNNDNLSSSYDNKNNISELSGPESSILPDLLNSNSNLDVEIIEIDSDDNYDEFEAKAEYNDDNNTDKIRNRLIFEDEEEDIINPNGLIHDLMADIKVAVPLEPWMSSIADGKKNEILAPGYTESELEEEWRSKTVSYQKLIELENISCKYCQETFPNRLSVIKHESSHIATKKRHPFLCVYCDWYVSSDPQNLRKHQIRSHPSERETQYMLNVQRKTCSLCKLKYISKQKHYRNYHGELEHSDNDYHNISKPVFLKKIIKICDLCCSFLKNVPNKLYYKTVGEESVSGKRQTCGHCMKQYFSINLVEVTTRLHNVMRPRKSKPVSNMDRLKNFKNRLKLLNAIKKY
ncbi:uncharacterized protein LOC128676479 [Plodia interpunctella]|uniref:uncharacterized protein LOC128676479 n=1 Tax=Plodia interpunctella TaxID=58824 RepID=UPI00236750DE|nr:uncharacterized protein LOC128676479 [Plodia interpunctella]